jgi:hypothetical protein
MKNAVFCDVTPCESFLSERFRLVTAYPWRYCMQHEHHGQGSSVSIVNYPDVCMFISQESNHWYMDILDTAASSRLVSLRCTQKHRRFPRDKAVRLGGTHWPPSIAEWRENMNTIAITRQSLVVSCNEPADPSGADALGRHQIFSSSSVSKQNSQWNKKDHYRFHVTPLLASILSQITW